MKIRPDLRLDDNIDLKKNKNPFSYIGIRGEMSFDEFGKLIRKIRNFFKRIN